MMKFIYLTGLLITIQYVSAQYPPPAGQAGSTAIHVDSVLFTDWASNCYLARSYMNIADTSTGLVSHGNNTDAIGTADNNVVSLGDGGYAIVTFDFEIFNGPGPDFAIFENAFLDNYLELAHVEVSSDGNNFIRFPSVSLTDTLTQTSSFGVLDATKIHNLAGKYRVYYGTPFDLQELSGNALLNINSITHIKIIDVVGSINEEYCSRDGNGDIINDPWPTNFESGGFDLDAIGVIHSKINGIHSNEFGKIKIYPTPVVDQLFIESDNGNILEIRLCELSGKITQLYSGLNTKKAHINLSKFKAGIYSLQIISDKQISYHKVIKVNN